MGFQRTPLSLTGIYRAHRRRPFPRGDGLFFSYSLRLKSVLPHYLYFKTLKKERKETKQPKISSMCDIPMDTQFTALKDQIERSKMLEDVVSKIYSKTTQILKLISQSSSSLQKRELSTVPSCKSLPSLDISNRQDRQDSMDDEIFRLAERTLKNMEVISANIEKPIQSVIVIEKQNKKLK